ELIAISVVIPTLDAADGLTALLPLLKGSPVVTEIVVSDGGSRDGSATMAAREGAKVVESKRGRGMQLAAGATATSGQWLLFIHADCQPGEGWEEAVAAFVQSSCAADCAGYFSLVLDDDAVAARRLERIVAWRCRWLGLPYGDQGLLIHRKLYEALG